MSIEIIKNPSRVITNRSSMTSKWVAAFNPIMYHFQRKDYNIHEIRMTGSSNNFEIQIDNTFLESLIDGDFFYIPITYNGVTLILQLTYATGGGANTVSQIQGNNTLVCTADMSTLGVAYPTPNAIFTPTTGFVNVSKRINYRLKAQITESYSTLIPVGSPLYFYPDITGLIKVQVQKPLQSKTGFTNNYDYSTRNVKDTELSGTFNIYLHEEWMTSFGSWYLDNDYIYYPDDSNLYFWVNTARQVSRDYGQNLGKYVLNPLVNERAKWMTNFDRPTKFLGYPLDLSFIYSELCDVSYSLVQELIERDKNGSMLHYSNNSLDPNNPGYVHRLLVDEPQYSNCSETEIYIYSNKGGVSKVLTDQIYIDIACLPKNPIALYWLSKDGSIFKEKCGANWDMWAFGYNNVYSKEISDGANFEQWIEDLADTNKREETVTKFAKEKILLTAINVPVSKIKGIQGILDSVQVLWMVNTNPITFLQVKVKSGDFVIYETVKNFYNIQFQIELPGLFNQNK